MRLSCGNTAPRVILFMILNNELEKVLNVLDLKMMLLFYLETRSTYN